MKKSEMLPGLAADQWARPLQPLGRVLISVTFVGAAAYFVTGATAETVPPWLYAIFAVAIAIFSVGMFVMFVMLVKAHRESKAGYTTTGGMYPELPQLDSQTGQILREGGQVVTAEQREGDRSGEEASPLNNLLADDLYERLSRRFGDTVFLDLDTDGPLVQLWLYPLGWDGRIYLIFADVVVLGVDEHVRLEYYSGDTAQDSDDLFDTIVDIARQGVYAYRKGWGIAAGFGPPPPGIKVLQYNAGWEPEAPGESDTPDVQNDPSGSVPG